MSIRYKSSGKKPLSERPHSAKIRETKGYIRMRMRNPKEFKEGSLRTHDIGRKGRTKRIAGKLKKNGEWETQALIYKKKDFGREKAVSKARKKAEATS